MQKKEWKKGFWFLAIFLLLFYVPFGASKVDTAIVEGVALASWYAREHVLLCLVPAFFIAGAISVFITPASVLKYLGAKANKILAYGVASISGALLAVCSCTILPLFAGIYRMGAGLGPATAFLYAGPAINIMAVIITARILGPELGIARAVGAVSFSIIIGLLMHAIFRKEETATCETDMILPLEKNPRSVLQNTLYFAAMTGILIFANWGESSTASGVWASIYQMKWKLTAIFALGLGGILIAWFHVKWWKVLLTAIAVGAMAYFRSDAPVWAFTTGAVGLSVFMATDVGEKKEWFKNTWGFAKQILPLLLFGVLIAGALLGRTGQEGLIPSKWIYALLGGNSFSSTLFASIAGAFMYFATLTEVPIVQGLMANGMGKGPALTLLLSGPALSLPNMLIIKSVIGLKKTIVFVSLVIVMATVSGYLFGYFFA